MFISLIIYLLILFLNKINNLNLILGNLTIIVLLINLFNFNWIDWINIFCNLRFNCYSYGLIILTLWIFGLIFISLNNNRLNCLLINLLLFYLFYEFGLLLIFYLVVKWGYRENRDKYHIFLQINILFRQSQK